MGAQWLPNSLFCACRVRRRSATARRGSLGAVGCSDGMWTRSLTVDQASRPRIERLSAGWHERHGLPLRGRRCLASMDVESLNYRLRRNVNSARGYERPIDLVIARTAR
jgi:hypothetical protein